MTRRQWLRTIYATTGVIFAVLAGWHVGLEQYTVAGALAFISLCHFLEVGAS